MAIGVSWDRVPTAQLPEADLFRAYRNTEVVEPVRVEPCVCGGEIAVALEAPAVIQRAVEAHQLTPAHQAWRIRMEASR